MLQEDSYLKEQQYRQDLQRQIQENQARKLQHLQQRKLIQQIKNQRIQEQIQLQEQARLQLRRRLPLLPQLTPQFDREKLKEDLRLKFQQDNPFYLGLKNKPTIKLVKKKQAESVLRETQQNFSQPRAGKVQVFKRENQMHRQLKEQTKRQYNFQLYKQIQQNKVRRYSQILKRRSEEEALQIKERAERQAEVIRLRERQRIQMAKLQQQRLFRQRFEKKLQQLQIQNQTLKKSKRIRTEESLNRSIESFQVRPSRVHTRTEERERSLQQVSEIKVKNSERPKSRKLVQKEVNTTSQLSQILLNKQLTNLRMQIKRQNQIIYTQLKKVETQSKAKCQPHGQPAKAKKANPQQFRSLKDLVGKGEGWKSEVQSLLQLLDRG